MLIVERNGECDLGFRIAGSFAVAGPEAEAQREHDGCQFRRALRGL